MIQTGEVPTKRKNKAYAVIKNEMEERERAKKRVSKNMVRFNQKCGWFQLNWVLHWDCLGSTPEMLLGRLPPPSAGERGQNMPGLRNSPPLGLLSK